MMLNTPQQAWDLLQRLQAPEHLLRHVTLVTEASELLLAQCAKLNLVIDENLVRVGVLIHDIGKIQRQDEMFNPGGEHEIIGEQLLLEHGASAELARICRSHARYAQMPCRLEELLIALADKLWKGKREETLELRVIDEIAHSLNQSRWDVFPSMDQCFEQIAAGADDRLRRSQVSV